MRNDKPPVMDYGTPQATTRDREHVPLMMLFSVTIAGVVVYYLATVLWTVFRVS